MGLESKFPDYTVHLDKVFTISYKQRNPKKFIYDLYYLSVCLSCVCHHNKKIVTH